MVFLRKGESRFDIHFGGRKFFAELEGTVLSVRPEKIENDATTTLHDLAMALCGYAGGEARVSMMSYPREARIEFPSKERFDFLLLMVSSALKEFVARSEGPLQALLLTLYSCGETRSSIAERCDLSQARVSMMCSDPGCCTTSRPMFRLRNFVLKKYEELLPLAEAAEAYSRAKLGEFFVRGGKNND